MVRKLSLVVAVVAGLLGCHSEVFSASLDPQMFFALNHFYSRSQAKPVVNAVSSDPIMITATNTAASDPIMGQPAQVVYSDPIMGQKTVDSDPIMGRQVGVSSDPIMGKVKIMASSDPIMGRPAVSSDPIMVQKDTAALDPQDDSDPQLSQLDLAVNTLLADLQMYKVLTAILKSDPIMIKHLQLVLSDPQILENLKENLASDPVM